MNTPQTDDRSVLDEGSIPSGSMHNANVIMEYSVVKYKGLTGWIWHGLGGIKLVADKIVNIPPFEKVDLLMSPPELAEAWVKRWST